MTADRSDARRAVEALRSGVPSAAAVAALGGGQPRLEQRFADLLDATDAAYAGVSQQLGFVLRGGFGEGKSHLLTTFEHAALERGFAVSRVVISKETPLQDPAKLLSAAVEAMRVPQAIGRGLDEVGVRLRHRFDTPEFTDLVRRLADEHALNSRFGATLFLYESGAQDEELADRVLRFWSGDKLAVTDIRRALRELGQGATWPLEMIRARDLALQTFTFLPQLLRAAGLRGWVLLVDEVELVGRYTRLQRARSYAELARWLGGAHGDTRPGLVAVAAITNDFASEVLIDRGDLDQAVPLIEMRDPALAPLADRGMRLIEQAELLLPVDDHGLRRTYETLRRLHGEAYGWSPPDVAWPETLGSSAMRTYVRAWINAWDVRRLYPGFAEGENPYEFDEVRSGYGEDASSSPEEPSDGDVFAGGATDGADEQ